MAPMSNDTRNAQRAADTCPDPARTQLGMMVLDLVLHALDATEVAHGLDAQLEGRVRVRDDERPGVVLHR